MSKSADLQACAAKLQRKRLASVAKFLEFYAAKFCAREGKFAAAGSRVDLALLGAEVKFAAQNTTPNFAAPHAVIKFTAL